MVKFFNEPTGIKISFKTLIAIGAAMATVISMWFILQGDIADAKELPKPSITRIEFDMKDELIRQTIMDTQEDVEEIKETLNKMDERLYEIAKKQ